MQEDIVYLSAERIVLTGRIVSKGVVNASDHGFVISTDEQLSNPITITLGPQNIPGRFVGRLEELIADSRYWVSAYADINGIRVFSDKRSFSTLRPSIQEFNPKIGASGETVIIEGSNFTNNTQIFFGQNEAQVLDITGESIIKAVVPQSTNSKFSTITITSQGASETFSEPFEYVIGKWERVSLFPVNEFSYRENFWTENEDFAVFGLGDFLFTMQLNNLVFLYSKKEDLWSTLEYQGEALVDGFAAWPYFGSGTLRRGIPSLSSRSLYRIDENEITKVSDLPIGLVKSIAFSFDESLFVFGGIDSSGSANRNIFEYDIDQDKWEVLEGRQFFADADYPTFEYKNEGYHIDPTGLVMKFNPQDRSWTNVAQYPTTVNVENIAQVVGSKVYVGVSKNRKDMWELDLETLEWKRKEPFSGDFRSAITSSWQYNNTLFCLRHNAFSGRLPMEIWKFTPEGFQ